MNISSIKRCTIVKFYVIAFLLPIGAQILAYAMGGFFPFGDKTLLIWDMDNQYISYFSWLNRVIKGESIDTLLYSFSVSYGGATIGLLGYYLLSPFNLLLLFFSGANLPLGVQVVIMCKIGSCGISMYYFLSKRFGNNNYMTALFSMMYALMGYNVTQQINVMWLDSVIILPVLLLWVSEQIMGKKRSMLPILITIAVVTNFYTAYMIIAFSILYFFVECILQRKEVKYSLKKFFLFLMEILLGLGMSSGILLPVLGEIMNVGRGGSGGILETLSLLFTINKKIFMLPMKELLGAYDRNDLIDGLPNIFISIYGFVLFIFYLLDKRHSKREKAGYGILIGTLLLSFISVGLNQIWHGFTYTSGCNYRYSFCLSFVMIVLAYLQCQIMLEQKTICRLNKFSWLLLSFLGLWFMYVTFEQYTGERLTFSSMKKWEVTGCAFLVVLMLIIMFTRSKHKKIVLLLLTGYMLIESSINIVWSLSGFECRGMKDYCEFYTSLSSTVNDIKDHDHESFFRIEHELRGLLNDAMLIGYPSITHYSSVLQDEVAQYAIEHNSLVEGIGRQATAFRANQINAEQAGEIAIKYLLTYELPDDTCNWEILKSTPFYVLENEKFKGLCYLEKQENNVQINMINSGNIHVNVRNEKNDVLVTSIPYRKGWSLMVDGVKREPILKNKLMITVPLTAGAHEISLQYHQPYLALGTLISLASLLIYLCGCHRLHRRNNIAV